MRDEQLAQFVETADDRRSGAQPRRVRRASTSEHYISAVLARFRNPGIRHLLSQIAWDGSKKLPVRIVVTIAEALRAGPPRPSAGHAAWPPGCASSRARRKAGVAIVDPDAARLAEHRRGLHRRRTRGLSLGSRSARRYCRRRSWPMTDSAARSRPPTTGWRRRTRRSHRSCPHEHTRRTFIAAAATVAAAKSAPTPEHPPP